MKTILITGAGSGIGKALAKIAAKDNHNLILLVRPNSDTDSLLAEMQSISKNVSVDVFACDLAVQRELNAFCNKLKQDYRSIDILINNAAIYSETRQESIDHIELNLAVNVLAPFMLVQNLKILLRKGDNPCVYNISSIGERYGMVDFNDIMSKMNYSGNAVYNKTKLLLTMLTYKMAELYRPEHIAVNCIHPGATATNLVSQKDIEKMPIFLKIVFNVVKHFRQTPERAADIIYRTILDEKNLLQTGIFFANRNPINSSDQSRDPRLIAKTWEMCERLTNSK